MSLRSKAMNELDNELEGLDISHKAKSRDNMTPHEKFQLWKTDASTDPDSMSLLEDIPTMDDNIRDESDDDDDDENSKDVGTSVVTFVTKTSAYAWLTAILQRNLIVNLPEADIFNDIGNVVASALQFRRGHAALRPEEATIVIPWNPNSFIQEQEYEGNESLLTALTITGEASKAQMTSCIQYTKQIWPLIGQTILEGLISATAREVETTVTSECAANATGNTAR